MPQYKDYEDWQRQQQARFKTQVQGDLPENQYRVGEPLDFPTRKIGDEGPATGFADKNSLYDFIGNVVWGFGETFLAPTILDIYSEQAEEGFLGTKDLSAEFGSQDWKDESWAGRTGYMLGTAGGILTGIGAVGKGLGLLSKMAGAGTKQAAKQLITKAPKGLLDDGIAKSIIQTTRKNIDDAARVAKEGTNFTARAARKSLKHNPLGDPIVLETVEKGVRKELMERLGLEVGDESLEKLTKSAMTEAMQSKGKHFGHSIGYKLKSIGWNPKVAQLTGDVMYEAALLGAWDTVVGELGGDLTANVMGLDKTQWEFDEWYKRAAHGMTIGAVLAPIRYIKGGKQVAFGKTGMIADLKHMSRFIASRFRKGKDMTDNQLKAFATSVRIASGKPINSDGMNRAFLKRTATSNNGVLTVEEREIYENAFNHVVADIPMLTRKLAGEIGRDGYESFLRASVGSFAMNYSAYKQFHEMTGVFPGMHEDYPLSKLAADHWVGMLYMKRGKVFEGKPAMPRFYDQTGIEANGSEIARMLDAMNMMGKDNITLDIYNRYMTKTLDKSVQETLEQGVMNNDLDARQIVDAVRKEFVTGKEYVDQIEIDKNLDFWAIQARKEVSEREAKVDKLREQGKTEEADALAKNTKDLRDNIAMAVELSGMALFGYSHTTIRPMDRKSALEFVDSMGKMRLEDGTPLTSENFAVLENRIETAKLKVTEQIQSLGMGHIYDSLKELGLVDVNSADSGKLEISRTVLSALYSLRSHPEKNRTTGEFETPYEEVAGTLIEAIERAELAGSLKFTEGGIEYSTQKFEVEALDRLVKLHKLNTENLHEIVFNSVTPESSWREQMPGWSGKEGFFDPYILGRTPIWHSIQTANRYKRDRLTYEGFTNRENKFYKEIFGKLKGNETFRIVEKEGDEMPAELEKDDLIFHNNLNHLLQLLNKEGNIGVKTIEVGELQTLKKSTFTEFGNVLADPAEFSAFNNYLYKHLINDMTGNSAITTGLRNVIKNGLNPESLLTMKDHGLVFRSARALRESLADRPDISETQRTKLLKMIDRYEKEIEIPLKAAMKNGGMIRFGDRVIDTTIPGNDPADLIQTIQESLNEVNKFSFIELGEFAKLSSDTGVAIAELTGLLSTEIKTSKELAGELVKLGEAGRGLSDLFNVYIGHKDVIGLRYLLDSREVLNEFNTNLSTAMPKDTKSIQKYKETLEKYINDAIDRRSEELEITDMTQLEEFYQEKIERISLSDRSNRPHQGNTSISTNQYESKWRLPEDFAIDLTVQPRKIMDALGILIEPRISVLMRDMYEAGVGSVLREQNPYTPAQYIDTIIEPVINSMRAKIEASPEKYRPKGSTREAAELFEDFVIDTYFIVQSAMSSKKLPVFTFENGVGNISETNVSNWDVGINRIARLLGLKEHGSISLFGQRVGTEHGFTSKLTPDLRAKMFAMLESGVMVDINTKEVLRAEDVEILERFQHLIGGRGKDGGTEFIPVQLDEKTLVVIPATKAKTIARAWEKRDSKLRQDLEFLLNSTVNNATESRRQVEEYLSREIGASFNEVGDMSIQLSNPNIQKLVMLTRLSQAFPHAVPDVMNNTMSVKDGLATLKYIKMDSPRSGIALNERTLGIAKNFLPRFLEDGSNLQRAYDVFENHYFDAQGRPTEHRTVNIFDEAGDSRGFFDSSVIARRILTRQLSEHGAGLTSDQINERVETMMKGYDKLTASVQNAEKYLSLPEMVSMLMVKGARRDWFVWDEAGNPIGFNVAIKPIEMYSKIDRATGEIVTSVGKTAYKYHPDIDALMHVNGDYFLDSIGMESSHKVHRKFNRDTNEWESPGIAMEIDAVDNWQAGMGFTRDQALSQRMSMDRGAIFIKSISGIHDATIAFGFSNLLSNDAQRHLNNVTGVDQVIDGLTSRYAALAENPFAYKHISQQLLNWQGESGDAIGRITGVESVLAVNGLPLFEFMMPHIDKMITSEFMGTRNLTSSAVKTGNYSVMTSGPGLSLPERRNNVQYAFGGSGIPHAEWEKPISGLVSKGGEEGLSFIFKATPDLIKEFKLEGVLEPGNDILVSHDGLVMSPHLDAKFREQDFGNFSRGMNKYYEQVLDLIKENPAISSLGDVALFLNGTLQMGSISDMTHKLDNKLGVTPSEAALYNKIINKKGKISFQSIHVANTDLRQPKAGLNDWVITRIEKLLDRRRGPVSEMNLKDVIDPQDADFDLDKSSSLYALPGKVLNEVYNVSGYFSPATDAFDTVLKEVILTEHMDVSRQADAIKALENKRPSLIRQQSILSNLLQYFSTSSRGGVKEFFLPGDTKDQQFARGTQQGFFIGKVEGRRQDHTISLREGIELVDSMGYMKKLIKATIDIYKTKQVIDSRDLDKLIWTDPEFGLLKVTSSAEPNKAIPYDALPKEVRNTFDNLIDNILKPIGDIYNLNRMTENFSDGTSRKMTAFEMVYKYEQALTDIRYAGYRGEQKQLEAFSQGILEFLGNNHFKGESTSGLSEQPLIKALVGLRKGMQKSFMGDVSTIPHDSGLAEILAGKQKEIGDITNAIAGIIADEKHIAQITTVQYRLEQIRDIVSSLKSSRRLKTSSGKYWEGQEKIHQDLINEFNLQINDPTYAYDNNIMRAKHSKGSGFATDVTRVYRKIGDEVRIIHTYSKNEKIFWNKGDVLVENPKTLVAGNSVVSRVRRAMHDAFARKDSRVSDNEFQIVDYQYREFKAALAEAGTKFVDPEAPRTAGRLGLKAEAELGVLADYMKQVGDISPDNATALQQQFLYRLLTPDASENVFDIVGWNPNTKKKDLYPHFRQNKRHERLVFQFLNRAMSKKAEMQVGVETATEWHEAVNNRFKAAFIKQYSSTIKENVFNFEKTTRSVNDFSLMPKADQLPRFVYDTNINEKARDVLQSYLNGTYFLDPVETYRLSVDLKKGSLEELPNIKSIGDQIDWLWQGTDGIQLGKGAWYKPGHSFRKETYHNPEKGDSKSMKEGLREIYKNCF